MRSTDSELVPEAVKRQRNETVLLVAGLVIAAAGLVAAFTLEGALYLGFGSAMIGTGLIPFEKLADRIFK